MSASVSVSVSSGCIIDLLQLCADRFPHSRHPDQPEIILTVNDSTSTETEKSDSGSKSQNLSPTSDEQGVRAGEGNMKPVERRIRTLARVQGLEETPINLWTVAFKDFSETATRFQNVFYKREEEMRSAKNEIYQVVGFFSAFQGLLITAAAQSNLLRCNNVGFILALSALATAVAVFGILQKIKAMEVLRVDKDRFEKLAEDYHRWVDDLQKSGIQFNLHSLQERDDPSFSCKAISLWYGILLLVSVIAFGAVCPVAMHQIVCNPGHSLPSN